MKSLIINRDKYIKTRSSSYGALSRIAIVIFSLVCAVSILGSSLYAANKDEGDVSNGVSEKEISYSSSENSKNKEEQSSIKVNNNNETNNAYSDPEIIRSSVPEKYLVTRVVDGDTIYVSGIKKRIRLIGINTPEIYNESVQCYGPEASNYLKEFILGKYVGLESDATSGDVDIYGRPLRYVYYNGENVNQKILLEGYGEEASYGSEYKYRAQFIESEKSAIANNKGLWSPDTCNGQE